MGRMVRSEVQDGVLMSGECLYEVYFGNTQVQTVSFICIRVGLLVFRFVGGFGV